MGDDEEKGTKEHIGGKILTGDKTGLLKISYIYKWVGGILIALGLFLLFGSLIAAIDDENVTNEPMFGAFFLSGGIFSLFAGYLGEAIDDIRNNTKK